MKVQKMQRKQNHTFVTFFLANMKSYKSFNLGKERRFMVPVVTWSQGINGYYFHILFPIKAHEGFFCGGGSDRKRRSKTLSHLNLSINYIFIYFHFNFILQYYIWKYVINQPSYVTKHAYKLKFSFILTSWDHEVLS